MGAPRAAAKPTYRATGRSAVRSALLGLGLAVMKDGSPRRRRICGGFARRLGIAIGPEIPRTTVASLSIVAITLVVASWLFGPGTGDRVADLGPEIGCPDDPAGAQSLRGHRRPDARPRTPVSQRTAVGRSAQRSVGVEILVAAAGKPCCRSAGEAKRSDIPPKSPSSSRSSSSSPGGRC